MKKLGTLRGRGNLMKDGSSRRTGYQLSVYQEGAIKSANGQLTGSEQDLFEFSQGSTSAFLVLEGGDKIAIHLRKYELGRIWFEVTGPVPGDW